MSAFYADETTGHKTRQAAHTRRRWPDHPELTYLAHSNRMSLYKIGHTKNIERRFLSIRCGCPDAGVIRTYAHDRDFEAFLKAELSDFRFMRSEWYDIEDIGGQGIIDQLCRIYEMEILESQSKAA